MPKKCAEENCGLTAGWWIETDAAGKRFFCYKVRHRGEYHVQRIPFLEIEQIIRDATGFKTAAAS